MVLCVIVLYDLGVTSKEPSKPGAAVAARASRKIVASWRALTGGAAVKDAGRRTLVAVSGGADSSALVLALAAYGAAGSVVVGHVVHDMRSREECLNDRDWVRKLAARAGVGFVERSIAARSPGSNYEADARRLRYAALGEMARETGCGFVATAHHADDQLETLLMRLLRGAGPGGLRGIATRRRLDAAEPKVTVVRPMLAVTHEDAIAICRDAGWEWREDPTNSDGSRLRSALRSRVLPVLRELAPHAALRAVDAGELSAAAWALVTSEARDVLSRADRTRSSVSIGRGVLAAAERVVAGEVLRRGILEVSGGRALDRIPRRTLASAVRAIRDCSGERREIRWRGVRLVIERDLVLLEEAALDGPETDAR